MIDLVKAQQTLLIYEFRKAKVVQKGHVGPRPLCRHFIVRISTPLLPAQGLRVSNVGNRVCRWIGEASGRFESVCGYSCTCVKRSLWPSMVIFLEGFLPLWLLTNIHQVLLCRKKGVNYKSMCIVNDWFGKSTATLERISTSKKRVPKG